MVVAVFFDVEKAYDLMWREGLLIKLRRLGVSGLLFGWVRDFLTGRKMEVRVGRSFSGSCEVGTGTPQGSVISPLLFSIMIDDVFGEVEQR